MFTPPVDLSSRAPVKACTPKARAGLSSGLRRQVRGPRGITLVEVLIVVVLIALMSGAVVAGTGMLGGTRLRSGGSLIISSVRLAMARANSTGRPVRMVMDLDRHRIVIEESRGKMLVERDDGESTGAGAEPVTEAERDARKYSDEILKGPRKKRARFQAITDHGFSGDDGESGRTLGTGIRFRQVQTDHDDVPRNTGRAYLYFWPGGDTERCVVQLYRGDEKEVGISVVVHGLTGRAKIHRGQVELTLPKEDDLFGEREE